MVICGDLTDTGDESEAQVLSEELQACSIPVVAVLGNHDYEKGRHKLIRQIVQNENVHILDGESVVVKNVGFAGIKGFGGGFDARWYRLASYDSAVVSMNDGSSVALYRRDPEKYPVCPACKDMMGMLEAMQ